MHYTIQPEEKHAKAYGNNLRVSMKKSTKLSKFMRGKKLTVVRRFLNDLMSEKRNLDGKYYTKTAEAFISLLDSCEKNAENLGLEKGRLFFHSSAHMGNNLRRKRRKANFGSKMKTTNLEIILIQR